MDEKKQSVVDEENVESQEGNKNSYNEKASGETLTDEKNTVIEENVEQKQEDWESLAADRYDQLIRLRADFDNFRRRVEREREELRGYVTGSVLHDILPVYDNLDRAIRYMPNEGEAKSWRVGVEMTLKGFDEVLGRLGVKPIAAKGLQFDPRIHEAVARVASTEPEGIIVEEVLKGFQWNSQVLRASLVKVSTGEADESQHNED